MTLPPIMQNSKKLQGAHADAAPDDDFAATPYFNLEVNPGFASLNTRTLSTGSPAHL